MKRVISASLSPNTKADDVWLTLQTLLTPWKWVRGGAVRQTEMWFEERFSGYSALSFNSGRSALFELLKAFGIHEGDEVMVQAFTCVAVPNSVRWTGAKPIYADIDDTLNIDVRDAQRKVNNKTRAIIVQHTFGVPADMDAICAFAKQHKLLLIEDCAHSLGAVYKGNEVGMFGDASFFSFGRDKVISSVFGGMAIINSNLRSQISNLKKNHDNLSSPSGFWIFQQLFHPIAFAVILPLYSLGVGKLILYVLQRLWLLSFPVYPEEKKGSQPADFPAKYPNALAILLVNQLKKLELFNTNRVARVREYQQHLKGRTAVTFTKSRGGAIFLRCPILVSDPKSVIAKAKQNGVLLGNWYHNIIDPTGVDFKNIGYSIGYCPCAEEAAKHIINLPTMISTREVREVIDELS